MNCFVNELFAREVVSWLFKILQIESVKIEPSLTVLSCFSDMSDKNRKIANSFWNTSYENKLSKIGREMGNGCIKTWKKKDKVFLCNDITQVIKVISEISEIYVNLKRQFLR